MSTKKWMSPIIFVLIVMLAVTACQPASPAAPAPASPTTPPALPTTPPVLPTTPPVLPTKALGGAISDQTPTAAPVGASPIRGGKLTMAMAAFLHWDADSVDQDTDVYPLVYETLFEFNQSLQPVGLLVKDVKISDDGLVHTWTLQDGVTFSDGTKFDANVVKWNFDRKISLKQPGADVLNWTSLEVVDPLTIRVTFAHPNFAIYDYLTSTTYSMYSPTFVQKSTSDDLKNQAVGTGPFIISKYVPNQDIQLVRNDNYWKKGQPYLDEIEVKIVDDPNTRLLMLESGEAQWVRDISSQDIATLKAMKTSGIVVDTVPSTRWYYISMNDQRPPMDNPKVRQAFNYAIDKDGMNTSIFGGTMQDATDVVTSSNNGYVAKTPYTYDPEKAKQMLTEAGLVDTNGDGFRDWQGKDKTFILVTRKGQRPGDIEIAEQVQALLGQVGINVKINVMDTATYFTYLNQPMDKAPYYDMSNQAPTTDTADLQYQLDNVFLCNAWPGNAFNYSQYCNKGVDALINQGDAASTLAERNKLYAEATAQIWADAPVIFLFDGVNSLGAAQNLQGVIGDSAHLLWNVKYAWLSK